MNTSVNDVVDIALDTVYTCRYAVVVNWTAEEIENFAEDNQGVYILPFDSHTKEADVYDYSSLVGFEEFKEYRMYIFTPMWVGNSLKENQHNLINQVVYAFKKLPSWFKDGTDFVEVLFDWKEV